MAMRLPIDISGLTLLVGLAPEPVVDFETRRPKADENGELLYQLQLVALGSEGAEVITVKVAGAPKGLAAGVPVKVLGLVALPWSMGDRSPASHHREGGCGNRIRGWSDQWVQSYGHAAGTPSTLSKLISHRESQKYGSDLRF